MADEVSIAATLGLIWVFTVVGTIFTIARLYTRLRIMNKVGLDDYLMGFSLICCYVFAILVTVSIHWGMGQHTSQLSQEQQQNALLYSTASFTPGILSFTVPKLGVTALLVRIMNPTRRFTIFLWVLVGSVDLIIFGCVIVLFAQCSPTRAVWTPTIHGLPGVKCWNPDILTYYSIGSGALSAFLDLFLALYPATVLYKLQMNRKKKLGLMIVLGMGIFACAISIYKATRLISLDATADYTFVTLSVFLWTSIEGNTIIIAASIPAIAPLLESIFGRNVFRGRSAQQSYYYQQQRKARLNIFSSNKQYQHHSRGTDSRSPLTPPAALFRDNHNRTHSHSQSRSISQSRSRQGSIQYTDHRRDVNKWMSPTLNSISSVESSTDIKHKLSPSISFSNPTTTTISSNNTRPSQQTTDVESQTSILDHHQNHPEEPDEEEEHEHEHEEEIEMAQISRHDSFTISYETANADNPEDSHSNTNKTNHNNNNGIESGGTGATLDKDGRPLSVWRRSFSKYGYPGFYQQYRQNRIGVGNDNTSYSVEVGVGDKGGRTRR